MKSVTQEQVKEFFDYKDGHLYWKKSRQRVRVGTIAGALLRKYGNKTDYWTIRLNGVACKAHRLIWLYHYGYLPKMLDHIDGDGLNNRIENLRPTTAAQNCQNKKITAKNKSGYKGVFEDRGRWRAEITAFGKRVCLGRFSDVKDAAHAVNAARTQLHGAFARSQ